MLFSCIPRNPEASRYYIELIIDYFENLTDEDKYYIKKTYGANGPIGCCRLFEKAIHNQRSDFNPEGYEKYWEDHSKEYNTDTITKITKIDLAVKKTIKDILMREFGDNYIKEIPKETFNAARKKVSDAEYEGEELDFWDALSLKNCQEIILNGSNWSSFFKDVFTLPSQVKTKGGKVEKTSWLEEMEKLQGRAAKSNFTVAKSTYELVCEIYDVFCG